MDDSKPEHCFGRHWTVTPHKKAKGPAPPTGAVSEALRSELEEATNGQTA